MKDGDFYLMMNLPMPPNLGNSRGHSRWSGAQKKRYFEILDKRQLFGMLPEPPKQPWDNVQLRADLHLGARMDDDNAKFRAYKWPADWLRTRGYIVDDKRPHCQMLDPAQFIKRAKDYWVTIYITPIE